MDGYVFRTRFGYTQSRQIGHSDVLSIMGCTYMQRATRSYIQVNCICSFPFIIKRQYFTLTQFLFTFLAYLQSFTFK